METKKLYYEDSHQRQFSATVLSCTQVPKGWEVILDATCFYPEGGGQACDLGTLGCANVLDVQEQGETVVHLCDGPLAVGSTVDGRIDWARRFDLMQQHSGEHILSGLIHQTFGYHNVGFHIGNTVMEVDFDGPITPEQLAELEYKANEAIWRNQTVVCWYPTEEWLAENPYRSKKALTPPVRIVWFPGYDVCACCGIHVKRTGQIGLIKVISCVKFHQGVRLQMVCGSRAFCYMSQIFEQNRQVSQLLSAKLPETADAAKRLAQQLAEEKFRSAGLQKRLFAFVANAYENAGNVLHFEDGLAPAQVRELCDAIGKCCGGTAAVLSGSDESGYSLCLMGVGAKEKGTAMIQALHGRGGGKPEAFQGSLAATKAQIASFWQDLCI